MLFTVMEVGTKSTLFKIKIKCLCLASFLMNFSTAKQRVPTIYQKYN